MKHLKLHWAHLSSSGPNHLRSILKTNTEYLKDPLTNQHPPADHTTSKTRRNPAHDESQTTTQHKSNKTQQEHQEDTQLNEWHGSVFYTCNYNAIINHAKHP